MKDVEKCTKKVLHKTVHKICSRTIWGKNLPSSQSVAAITIEQPPAYDKKKLLLNMILLTFQKQNYC